jgi:hypothetical protein
MAFTFQRSSHRTRMPHRPTQAISACGIRRDVGTPAAPRPGRSGSFLHQLTRRVALCGTVAGVVLALACTTTSGPGEGVQLDSLVITPRNPAMRMGGSLDLVATAYTSTGDTATVDVTWAATDGTVSSSGRGRGRYTPSGPGTHQVAATGGGLTDTTTVTVMSDSVVIVTVSPPSATLYVGATQRFTAALLDSAGVPLTGVAVTWGSSNTAVATVDTSGLVTARGAGSATITATSEGKSGTASVTTLLVPVASVSITPASGSVLVGQTSQLTATVKDSAGGTLTGRTVTWTSSDTLVARVNATGLATGVAAGTATIHAAAGGVTGDAVLTVLANQSGGGTILFQEGFEDDNYAGRGWYDLGATFTTSTTEVKTGARALEVHFAQGATTPSFGAARHLFTGSPSLYISYWVKYSSNWVGSGEPYQPHEFSAFTSEDGQYVSPAFNHLAVYVEHNYQNGGIPVLTLQDAANIDTSKIGVDLTTVTENRAVAGCNGNSDGYATGCYAIGGGLYDNGKTWMASQPYFLPDPGPGYKGDWHFVEAYFQLNSIQNGKGVADGVVRYWFDGQLVIDHADVLLRTGAHPNMQFNQFFLGFYMGDGSPVDQTAWVDDLTVATAKP